jgi:hypothetical protein
VSVWGPIFCELEDVPNRYNGAGVAMGALLPAVPTTTLSPPVELGSDLAGEGAPLLFAEKSELVEDDVIDDVADGGG